MPLYPEARTNTKKIYLVGFGNIPFYADTVTTIDGREIQPKNGELILFDLRTKPVDVPGEVLGRKIDEKTMAFIAKILKLDTDLLKKQYRISSRKKKVVDITPITEFFDEVGVSYYTRNKRGKPAIFVVDGEATKWLTENLGTRFNKRIPEWIPFIEPKLQKVFIENFVSEIYNTKGSRGIEFTTSTVNNYTLAKIFSENGFYINARKIEHKTVKNRELWDFILIPMTTDAQDLLEKTTGKKFNIRTKNVVNGRAYYLIK
jgi:hypothetical protein